MTGPIRMEDSRKDNLGVEKMVNGDRIQSMEENEVKKLEIQQMLGAAKDNQGFPFVNLTMQVGVLILGMWNIEQVVVWDQKTAQAVTFVLKSTLDSNAQPWLPQGRGQEYKEDEFVEEEDKNTEQHYGSDFKSSSDVEVEVAAKVVKQDTKVKTMSVEQMVKILAEKQYFTEAKEGLKQSEVGEQKVCHICCSANSLHKDQEGFSGIDDGHAEALNEAITMFKQNTVHCQENVVNHLVPKGVSQEGNRLFAQSLVEDVCRACDAWADQRFTQLGATAALQLRRFAQLGAKKWKEACLANEELCLELAQGMLEFEQKYLEDGPGQPENCKKMIKRMCNAYYATFTEMSAMYDDFATAEEDDSWKSWVTSDEYLGVLTLRCTEDEECELTDSSDEFEE